MCKKENFSQKWRKKKKKKKRKEKKKNTEKRFLVGTHRDMLKPHVGGSSLRDVEEYKRSCFSYKKTTTTTTTTKMLVELPN